MAFKTTGVIVWVFKFICIFFPGVLYVFFFVPFFLESIIFVPRSNFNLFQAYHEGFYLIGLLSAPGYLYALLVKKGFATKTIISRWILISLYSAFMASLSSLPISIWMIAPVPFSIGAIPCTYVVLKKYKNDFPWANKGNIL